METLTPARTDPYFTADATRSDAFDQTWASPRGPFAILRTINNIPIAQRYIAASFAFFLIGGILALLLRIQLARPENQFLDPETYNQLFTMHGTTMMFLFVIPFIEAIANYLLPLLLGTRDLPFPRLTTLALWTYIWGGLFVYASFLFGEAPAGGWFAYVPLTNRTFSPGLGMDFWDIGLSVAEIAAIGAAADIIVSVLRMRAPGMGLHRMPIFAWAILITAFMILFSFTPLIVGTAMLEFDRKGLTSFFVPEAGGSPLLWQHIFWIFGHPEVYIMFIPAIGMVSQVVQVFARRPLVSYSLVVVALLATAFISFGLWVHHMFATGLSPTALGFFAAASLMIAIPSGLQVFSWIATLWTGRPIWRTPLLFVAGFLVIFVIGGVTGVMVGSVPFDLQVHDSFFVVAHFHYVLIGGVIFPFYAGLYYWLPKITGRLLSERLGRWQFWLMFVSFNVAFFPMHILGLLGMPRRTYTYASGLGWDGYNLVSTIGALAFGLSAALIVANFLWSMRRGPRAGANPWRADTLEWWEPSPPHAAQFKFIPFVRSRHPLWEQETLGPQNEQDRERMERLRSQPTSWRGALVVSMLDAQPLGVVQMPGPTIWPFLMSLGFLVVFTGALLESAWIAGVGFAGAALALTGWFWPDRAQDRALAEYGHTSENELPLLMEGRNSNGWWGMIVFLIVLSVALVTFIGAYFYLGSGPATWPPSVPALGQPTAATAAVLVAGVLTWLFSRATRRRRTGMRRAALALAALATAAFIVLAWRGLDGLGTAAAQSAYASSVSALVAFNCTVAVVLLAALAGAQLWAWIRPDDPRGRGMALNAEPLGYFMAAGWVMTWAVVYVLPRVW